MKLSASAIALAALIPATLPGFAFAEVDAKIASYLDEHVRPLLASAEIQAAVKAANTEHAALADADIEKLDADWKAEVEATDKPLIKSVADSPTSAALKSVVAGSQGTMTEIILMDNKGLNVGVSDVTSDYWQGDEDKFQKTYLVGADAVDVSEVELDESTQIYQMQVSLTVTDSETGEPIGAVTVGLNAENF